MPAVLPTLFAFRPLTRAPPPAHRPVSMDKAFEMASMLGAVPGGQGPTKEELVRFGDISMAGTHNTPDVPVRGQTASANRVARQKKQDAMIELHDTKWTFDSAAAPTIRQGPLKDLESEKKKGL